MFASANATASPSGGAPAQPSQTRHVRDWVTVCVLGLAAYCLVLLFHAQDLPRWEDPVLWVGQERVMATHDAYHWLAGAKGFGNETHAPASQLVAAISGATGISVGTVGFWLPPLCASLVSLVVFLWAWTLGCLEAGLCAGVLAALAPGFFFRTRMGYYDTDIATLLFPLLVSWGMAWWLAPLLHEDGLRRLLPRALRRPATSPDAPDAPLEAPRAGIGLWWMVLAGVVAAWGAQWHGHIRTFGTVLFCLAAVWSLVAARPGMRPRSLLGVAVFGLAAFLGWAGVAVAAVLALADRVRPVLLAPVHRKVWPALAVVVLTVLWLNIPVSVWTATQSFVAGYFKPVVENAPQAIAAGETAQAAPLWPGIAQSVIEAQNLDWARTLDKVHPRVWLSAVGLAGFLAVLAVRPMSLFLLPLLVLGLASLKVGVRASMFLSPCFALGLTLPLVWAGRLAFGRFARGRFFALLLLTVVMAVSVLPYIVGYTQLRPTPVLHKNHGEALVELGNMVDPGAKADAKVWTWWDWGYATNYYAGLPAFADGARHGGEYLFPLALALSTDNPKLSAGIIRFSAAHYDAPWSVWNAMTPAEVKEHLDALGRGDLPLPADGPPRYLVVPYGAVRLMYWMGFYGSWDVAEGKGTHNQVMPVRGLFEVDYKNGVLLVVGRRKPMRLASVDVMDKDGGRHWSWPGNGSMHLLVNKVGGRHYLVDNATYGSMVVQLLLDDPGQSGFNDQFRLVYDGYPMVRVYEVRQ